ncbi:MAG: AAA family ATPase [Gammaproteobacteria bacterium]|nr:AAA family ATPase [Gammaproteobacteria bacterium]
MYESFFKLQEKPFSLLPDPGYLYLGQQHSTAYTMLDYGLSSQAGFTVISGEVGSGKTTLIRHLLNQQSVDVTVGLISNTHRTLTDLLQWVLFAFSLDYRNKGEIECYDALIDFLVQEYSQNRRAVLIVDEAQNLGIDALEELRVLSNVNADKDQVMQLILVGQPELRETLKRPELVQFAQRIAVDYHLGPLDEKATLDYIQHRLKVAGGDPGLIGPEACRAVYRASRGTPRLINTLCDTALVYAYGANQPRVTEELMWEVIRDKLQGGLFDPQPSNVSPAPEPAEPEREPQPRRGNSESAGFVRNPELRDEIDQLQQQVNKLQRQFGNPTRNRR